MPGGTLSTEVNAAGSQIAVPVVPAIMVVTSCDRVAIVTCRARLTGHVPHVVRQEGAFPALVVRPQDGFSPFGKRVRPELLVQVRLECFREVHRLPLPRTVRLPAGRPSILGGSVAPGISVDFPSPR